MDFYCYIFIVYFKTFCVTFLDNIDVTLTNVMANTL